MSESAPAAELRHPAAGEDTSAGLSAYERYELPLLEGAAEDGSGPVNLTQSQIEQLRAEAQAEGHQAGLAAGLAEGRERARAETATLLGALQAALRDLSRPFAELDSEVEEALVTLAITIARNLVHHELSVHPERIAAIVRETVEALPSAERLVTVHLGVVDHALLREQLESIPEGEGWQLREDPTLSPGGCRIETRSSSVDNRLETRVESAVADVLGRGRSDDA